MGYNSDLISERSLLIKEGRLGMKKTLNALMAVIIIGGFLSFPANTLAQAKAVKGSVVFLKIPYSSFQGKVSFWGNSVFKGILRATENGLSVNNEAEWRTSAFPPLTEYKIKKVKLDPQTGAYEVELASDVFPNVKLSIGKGKLDQLFPMAVATKEEFGDYLKETYKLLGDKFFGGTPLAGLSEEKKLLLCTYANITAKGITMGSEVYKDNLYLLIDLGPSSAVYNELKLNQVQRVALVLNERLLTVLKDFTVPVKDEMNIFGLKLEFAIPHRSFANENAEPALDKLEIYAPIDLILQFAEADITSQQFIDGCTVIVEGNRISVPLANY
jgi:hypothetical protein